MKITQDSAKDVFLIDNPKLPEIIEVSSDYAIKMLGSVSNVLSMREVDILTLIMNRHDYPNKIRLIWRQ